MIIDKIYAINMLYDTYSQLLTERQREALHLFYSEDYTLAEIAGEYDISRQAVHDLVSRALEALQKIEDKLGLCKTFAEQQKLLGEAELLLVEDDLNEKNKKRLKKIIDGLRITIEQ